MRTVIKSCRPIVWLVVLSFLGAPLATWSHMAHHAHLRSLESPWRVICTSDQFHRDRNESTEALTAPGREGVASTVEDCPFVQFQQSGPNLIPQDDSGVFLGGMSVRRGCRPEHESEHRSVARLRLAPAQSPPFTA